QVEAVGQGLRQIELVEEAARHAREAVALAELIVDEACEAAGVANRAELLIRARALLDGPVCDDDAQSALDLAPVGIAHAQRGARLVARLVLLPVEPHVEL